MSVYEFIKENYSNGEPILLSELPFDNKNYLRQEMKRLTDQNKLVRAYSGIYFLKYTNSLGLDGTFSIFKCIEKKFLFQNGKRIGFYSGLTLVNNFGFSSQNPSYIEVESNNSSTKQRKLSIDGYNLIIYSPCTSINDKNYSAMQFLELMKDIDKYSELEGEELQKKLKNFIKETKVDFAEVRKILPLCPDRTYKNLYVGGLMNELAERKRRVEGSD